MDSQTWDGVTQSGTLRKDLEAQRAALFKAAQMRRWSEVLSTVSGEDNLANVTCPDDLSLDTILHQAVREGASIEVVQRLLDAGAWRTVRNRAGEIPRDIAVLQGRHHLLAILKPVYQRQVPPDVLQQIERAFHDVIRERAWELVDKYALRLPQLEPLLEINDQSVGFAVPGMYGGFNYWLHGEGDVAALVTESWSRVVGGSGQRHIITSAGSTLVEEGFV